MLPGILAPAGPPTETNETFHFPAFHLLRLFSLSLSYTLTRCRERQGWHLIRNRHLIHYRHLIQDLHLIHDRHLIQDLQLIHDRHFIRDRRLIHDRHLIRDRNLIRDRYLIRDLHLIHDRNLDTCSALDT